MRNIFDLVGRTRTAQIKKSARSGILVLDGLRVDQGRLDQLLPTDHLKSLSCVNTEFVGPIDLSELHVEQADFSSASFDANASFDRAHFTETKFVHVQCVGDLSFRYATFESDTVLAPLHVSGKLDMHHARFGDHPKIEGEGLSVYATEAEFSAGVTMRLRDTDVVLDGSHFGAPSLIACPIPLASKPDPRRARLRSVTRTDLRNVVLVNIDVRRCSFAGTYNLDELSGTLDTLEPPRWPRFGIALPPTWWWSRRPTLFDEHMWRAAGRKKGGWEPGPRQPSVEPDTRHRGWSGLLTRFGERVSAYQRRRDWAMEVASLYRGLRKGNEDAGNAPGAAEFYYGEMEMRRKAAFFLHEERLVLWLYWLVSGYGQRWLRAVVSLPAVVIGFSWMISEFELVKPKLSWMDSLIYTIDAMTAVTNPPEVAPTSGGMVLRFLLRIVGLALLALTVLSIRNRVKR